MDTLKTHIEAWLKTAEAQRSNGGVTEADLDALRRLVRQAVPRQRLLYLHARGPSIYAPVIGMAEHEPVAGYEDTIRTREAWPYNTVHEAIVDGWQVVQFPVQMTPFDDRELDYVGYEFILHKIEDVIP
jgi:hypothetical protein